MPANPRHYPDPVYPHEWLRRGHGLRSIGSGKPAIWEFGCGGEFRPDRGNSRRPRPCSPRRPRRCADRHAVNLATITTPPICTVEAAALVMPVSVTAAAAITPSSTRSTPCPSSSSTGLCAHLQCGQIGGRWIILRAFGTDRVEHAFGLGLGVTPIWLPPRLPRPST